MKTITLSNAQLSLLQTIFAQATSKPAPISIEVKAESKPRDQKKAGKKSHEDVVETIRITAALLAIANWRRGSNEPGHFLYAKRAHRFMQQGIATVTWANKHSIEVKAIWGNYRMENRKPQIYTKTIEEWDALRSEYRPMVTSPKHAVVHAALAR